MLTRQGLPPKPPQPNQTNGPKGGSSPILSKEYWQEPSELLPHWGLRNSFDAVLLLVLLFLKLQSTPDILFGNPFLSFGLTNSLCDNTADVAQFRFFVSAHDGD